MDIDEWSQDSQAFKTITSGSETRNQTTNKKQYEKNTRSSPKSKAKSFVNELSLQQLQKELGRLQNKRVREIRKNKYKNLEKINNKIGVVKEKMSKLQERVANSMYEERQFAIYEQHEQQMKYFHEIWEDIFTRFRRSQHINLVRLQVQQQREVRELYEKLEIKKQSIVRRVSKNKDLGYMRKIENELVKKNKFEALAKLELQKKRKSIKKEINQRTIREINELEHRQLGKLRQKYNRKEICLKMKFRQCKEYEQKIFKRNEEKLKQKFMNSINNLEHNQRVMKSRCFSTQN